MKKMRSVWRCLAVSTGLFFAGALTAAHAHDPSQALFSLNVDGSEVHGRWDIALQDLDEAIAIDTDGDRTITWGEFQSRQEPVLDHLARRLAIATKNEKCPVEFAHSGLEIHGGITYAVVAMNGRCREPIESLEIDYSFLSDIDPTHRALAEVQADGSAATLLITNTSPAAVDIDQLSSTSYLLGFVTEGVLHIWNGFDHLAFLALLLLPAVLSHARGDQWKGLAWSIAKVVTAFTIAHSLTLGIATLGYVSVPARAVEIAIAGSITLAAALNFSSRMAIVAPSLAFGFGLLHGFGFATALSGLGDGAGARIANLLAFNLGVEVGQLVVVAVAVPVVYLIARNDKLRAPLHITTTVAVGLLGAIWMVQRIAL